MLNVWTPLHLHTDISNPSYFEVVSQADQYIDWAVKQGQKAICFTEHGNAVNWIKKKIHAEKAGLKFIFGIEAYVTMQLEDDTRYHTILIAKNYQGVQTILRLSSQSFNRQDRHFYRKPRIAFDELKQAFSEGNIYITTACLAGALGSTLIDTKDSDEVVQRKSDILSAWLELAQSNPDMFLFEIQPHNNPEQQQLNNACINYANYYGCRIVASNDIHALNPYHDKLRKIVKKGKGASYSNEDEFELWCKTYDEMVDSFVKCGVDEKYAKQALDTTNEIADSIETFELDRSHKYPHLYKQPEQEFQKRIKQGLHERGIDKLPREKQQEYADRINYEYKVYKHNGAIDYMLAHEDILNAAKEHGIHFGFGRGSCFIGDTSILMADYSTKRIQDVRKGDMVITHDGSPHEVKAIHRRKATRLIRTTFAGGLPLYSTENHKFLVRKRGERTDPKLAYPVSATPVWGRADELRNSDLLCTPIPRLKEKHIPIVDLTNYSYDNTNYDETSIWSDIGSNHLKRSVTKRFLNMANPDIAWLSGVYVGNGWAEVCRNEKEKQGNHYRFGVCFCGDQTEKIDRAKRILSNLVGADHVSTFKGYEGKNLVQLVVYNQFLSQFYLEQFGHYAANKKIPQFYMTSGNKETIKEFLKGMWQTDGHISQKEPRWKYSSTNKKLVEQLSILMMSLGFLGHPVCRVHKNIDWNDEYTLSYSGGQLYKMNAYFGFAGKTNARWNRFKKDANYFYGKVRKTEPIECDSIDVYDLTVEGNHSYIANNVAVHNCSGSLIAYLCGQTDMDSVKLGLNFERFMNPERVSLADIDVDSYSADQQWIQKWMLTTDKFHSASILTTNTYGLKGAIKAIADGLPRYAGKPQYIQSIRNQIDADGTIPQALYEEHKELIDMAKDIVGVTDSFGRHAAGIVVDTTPIDNTMGTMTIANWDYPVSQIAMKEIEYCAWVKFDMLGLDNVGLINKTAELAGIPYPTPNSDFIDFNDEKVWKSMRESNIGIFQFEGDRAGKILKQVFSDETVAKIKEQVPNYQYIDLLSLANAAQRPSGASYIDAIMNGEFKDNGHEALNKFLAPTLGFMVYQEQQIQFLVQFCGYTAGQADILRRAIGHKQKDVMEKELPKVHQSFVKTMVEKYGDSQEHADRIAEDFMQVFIDSANYGFSVNHSMAYSYIGYIATWLRYYYPLEFCTAAFEVWKDKKDKINKITKFAKERGIQLKPVKFGKSKGLYYMDKDTNTIYEGTATIKGCNAKIGDVLYEYGQNTYGSFIDMLIDLYENKIYTLGGDKYSVLDIYHKYSIADIKKIDKCIKTKSNGYSYEQSEEKTSVNAKNVLNLIALGYFGQFGSRKKLTILLNKFKSCYHVNNKTLVNKHNKYMGLLALEQGLSDDEYPLLTILKKEHELLGRCISVNHAIDSQLMYVVDFTLLSNKAKVTLYSPKFGKEAIAFTTKKTAKNIANDMLVKVTGIAKKPKNVLVDGQWRKSKTDYEHWITNIKMLGR